MASNALCLPHLAANPKLQCNLWRRQGHREDGIEGGREGRREREINEIKSPLTQVFDPVLIVV